MTGQLTFLPYLYGDVQPPAVSQQTCLGIFCWVSSGKSVASTNKTFIFRLYILQQSDVDYLSVSNWVIHKCLPLMSTLCQNRIIVTIAGGGCSHNICSFPLLASVVVKLFQGLMPEVLGSHIRKIPWIKRARPSRGLPSRGAKTPISTILHQLQVFSIGGRPKI